MEQITLFTNDDYALARVLVPKWLVPVEVYVWGERIFLRRQDGRYTEASGLYWIDPSLTVQ